MGVGCLEGRCAARVLGGGPVSFKIKVPKTAHKLKMYLLGLPACVIRVSPAAAGGPSGTRDSAGRACWATESASATRTGTGRNTA